MMMKFLLYLFVVIVLAVAGYAAGNSYNWIRPLSSFNNTDWCSYGTCDGNVSLGTGFYLLSDWFCLSGDCRNSWPSGGGTSSIFIDNATTENCSANHYLYGIAPNGSGYCREDQNTGGGDWKEGIGFLYNDSYYMYFNESLLNITIDERENDTGYNSTADIANALVSIIHVGDNSSIYLYTNGTYFWLNLQSFNTTTDHRIDLKYHDNSTSDIEAVIDANYHDNSTSDVLTVVNPLLGDINLSVKAYNSTQNDSITSAYTSAISSSNESLWVHSYSNLLNLSGNDVVIGDVRMVGDIWLTTDSDSTYIVTDNFKCNKSCILNMTTFEGVSNFNSPMFISADSAPVGSGIVGWGSPNNFWKSIYSLLFVSNMSGGLTDTYDLRVRNNAIVDGTFDVGKNSSIGNISLDRHSVIVIPYDDSTSFKIGETKSGTIGFVSIPYNPNIDYPVFSSQAGASLTGLFFGDKIKAKRNNVTSFYIDLTGGGNGNINLTGSSGKIQARDYISEDGSVGATNTNNVYICTSPSGTGCNNWVQVDIKDGLFIG